MQTTGSLILLVSIGLLLVGGVNSLQGMSDQAKSTSDANIVSQTSGVNIAINPVFYVMGFLALIVGSVIAIDAFK